MAKKLKKRSDITINGSTATYTFSHQSLTQGTLIGSFTFKCFLLPSEKLAIGREKRQLLGEFEQLATEGERFLAYALSELKYRVNSSPSFWNQDDQFPGNISEQDIIFKVVDAALYAEALFTEQKSEERKKLLDQALKSAEKLVSEQVEEAEKEQEEDKEADDES